MATVPRSRTNAGPRRVPSDLSPSRLRFSRRSPLTDQLFERLCQANPELRLERSPQGELIVMSPTGSESGGKNLKLSQRLGNWVDRTGLGVAFDSSTGFLLPNGAIRSPDASWIRSERWEALSKAQRQGFAPLCPDFVVELRSPGDLLSDLREKMAEYIDQGARLGWLIDPTRKVVEVYRPGRKPEIVKQPSAVSGEDVLPGFELDLKGILFG